MSSFTGSPWKALAKGYVFGVFDPRYAKGSSPDLLTSLKIQESPTVPTAFLQLLSACNPINYVRSSSVHSRTLLQDFKGAVRGGEMVMLIGKPGAGCSTFLKALANMRGQFNGVSGKVSYGGREPVEVMKTDPGCIAYCGEDDIHFGSLSVDMTLR